MNGHVGGNSLPHQRLAIFSSVHQPHSEYGNKNSKTKKRSTWSLPQILWLIIIVVGILVCYSLFHFTSHHSPNEEVSSKGLQSKKSNIGQAAGAKNIAMSSIRERTDPTLTDKNLQRKEAKDKIKQVDASVDARSSLDRLKQAQQNVIHHVVQQLLDHPIHAFVKEHGSDSIEDILLHISRQPQCEGIPIFVSMANVFSELYWQM